MATSKSKSLSTDKHLKIILIAGEDSGDMLGASLMQAMKKQSKRSLIFSGLGGPRMEVEGLDLFFSIAGLNLLGLVEVLDSVRTVQQKLSKAVEQIVKTDPDVVVTIDLPGFNKRLARRLRERSIRAKIIHYVAPTVWAWRPGRTKKFNELFDQILCLYPFEPPYFKEGKKQKAVFVGHPLAFEEPIGSAKDFRRRYGIDVGTKLIAVLSGSRIKEVERLLPVFEKVVERVKQENSNCAVVMPVVEHLRDTIEDQVKSWPVPIYVVGQEGRQDAYAACSVAIAASGTVALELAKARLPMVIAYKVHWLTAMIAKRLLKTKFVCLLNILAGKEVIPEFLQERCKPDLIAPKVIELMGNNAQRMDQVKEAQLCLKKLRGRGQYPSELAGREVLRGFNEVN